jgi:Ca-activated chloride channel family protein
VTSISLAGSRNNQIHSILNRIVAVLLALAFLLAGGIPDLRANTQVASMAVRPGDMTSGSLLLKNKDGSFLEAPRLGSDYTVTVSGPTGRTILTQRFSNPSDGWVEGIYVFPLPEGAAVDTLKIVSGNRVIVGEIKERQEAKIIYEEAKRQGQTAALLEQERPNIFTSSVANIGPHDNVVVQIEYQESIKQTGGTYSLRLPLVVAPRYNPAPVIQTVDFSSDGSGYGLAVNDPVPDRSRIEPPVLDPAKHAPVNPVSITIKLQAGFALTNVVSHHHRVNVTPAGDREQVIALAGGTVAADKDFELTWQAKGQAPQVGLFSEQVGAKTYVLATVVPPSIAPQGPALPRETIFVIDNSGSMDGPSMVQAKEALLLGLGKLTPADRFNVIRFDDTYDVLFPQAVPADGEHIRMAQAFVSSLSANGGTEMIAPLKAALADPEVNDTRFLRQVVFITDGAIGNEQEMFAILSSQRGRSRVFMVGIGSAPNSYLMTRAAELGRGTFTFIGDAAQVKARMDELFTKIGQPVITGLSATLANNSAVLTPSMLPDLYLGEPLLIMAEADTLSGDLSLSGMIGKTPWMVTLPLSKAAPGKGISKLWAHRKVADIEVAATLGTLSTEVANRQVLAVALAHQIVSSQTSLIAVDKTPKRPLDQPLTRAEVPLNLPAGWNFEKVFGKDQPLPMPMLERDAMAKAVMQLASTAKPVTLSNAAQQVQLPQTATPSQLLALIGFMLMLLAVVLRWLALRPSFAGQAQ